MKTTSLLPLALLLGCGPGPEDDPCEIAGNICTWAGVPQMAQFGPEDVPATESPLVMPQDVTFADDGTAYFPDFNNHRLRRVDRDGIVRTISGTGFLGDGPEGTSSTFAWNHPTGIAIDPTNPELLHVAAWHNSRINIVDLAAGTTTFTCGTGGRDYGGDDGPAISAVLDLPSSVAFDSHGDLYVTDQANQAIRRILADGTIELVAGSPGEPGAGAHNAALPPGSPPEDRWQDATAGYAGDGGPALDALLYAEIGQSADPSSRMTIADDVLYLADSGNNTVRKIDLATGIIDRVAGVPWHRPIGVAQLPVAADPTAGDGGPALDAYVNNPRDVAVGPGGEVYIADTDNHCVRVVGTDGRIETFAGRCGVAPEIGDRFQGEGEPATDAILWAPFGVAVDPDGNVYIADTKNHVIRRVAN